jgi:thymidylate synthase (FAD)
MQIITEPTATIVGRPEFVPHPSYDIPDDGDAATKLGSFAAKGCYDSFGKNGRSNTENQEAIMEHAHGSVMEHMHYSIFFEGITRGLSLELNRHRPFNISQRSTRYTKEEDSAIVLEPFYASIYKRFTENGGTYTWSDEYDAYVASVFSREADLLADFLTASRNSIDAYKIQVRLLEEINPNRLTGFDLRKWARGKARNLLPHGLETRGTWTNNLRGYRWFIESRSNKHAEPEIRILANETLRVLRTEAPLYFEDFSITEEYDGIPVWAPKYHKV